VALCGATRDRATAFALCAILENVTNSHDKPALGVEQQALLKVQQMAQAVGAEAEEHPKDDVTYVDTRLKALAASEIIPALAGLAKGAAGTAADAPLSRVLLTLASDSRFRGRMVQAGLHNVLLAYAQGHPDPAVQTRGAHALARIAIKANPNTAFAGQKAYELVRPLLALAHASHELQQFEAVLALTNLASMDDARVRDAIVAQKGLDLLQQLQTDDNPMIQRAATEGLCNMLQTPAVFDAFTAGPRMAETVKHWLLLAGSDDPPMARAAAGGLAQMSHVEAVSDELMKNAKCMEIVQGTSRRSRVVNCCRALLVSSLWLALAAHIDTQSLSLRTTWTSRCAASTFFATLS
jgi:hypothetical protein